MPRWLLPEHLRSVLNLRFTLATGQRECQSTQALGSGALRQSRDPHSSGAEATQYPRNLKLMLIQNHAEFKLPVCLIHHFLSLPHWGGGGE